MTVLEANTFEERWHLKHLMEKEKKKGPIRMTKICNSGNTKCSQGCETTQTLIHVGGIVTWDSWKTVCHFLERVSIYYIIQQSHS